VVDGVVVVVAVVRVRRVTGVAPHERDRRAVDRREHDAALADERAQVRGSTQPEGRGELDAGRAHAGLAERGLEPRCVRALRQPEAAAPAAGKARAVRGDPRLDLQPQRGRAGEQRQHGVSRGGGPLRVGRERCEQLPPAPLEAAQSALVLSPRAFELARERLVTAVAQAPDVFLVGAAADVVDEAREALADSRCFELVAEHGRERERQRSAALEQVEQRQVTTRDRLPEPLLAERPGAEALDVGHVGVQDDRQLPTRRARACARAYVRARGGAGRAHHRGSAAHGRQTAMKSSARSRSAWPRGRSAKSVVEIAGVNHP
jgi:hypothetical protein